MSFGYNRAGYRFQRAMVWIEGPGMNARLYAECVFNSLDAFEIAGAGWQPAIGAIELQVAVQRQESTWHGVGRVSTGARQYQFATVMTMALSDAHVSLSGRGKLRKTGEPVQLKIEAC
jgi:hypothetical protein